MPKQKAWKLSLTKKIFSLQLSQFLFQYIDKDKTLVTTHIFLQQLVLSFSPPMRRLRPKVPLSTHFGCRTKFLSHAGNTRKPIYVHFSRVFIESILQPSHATFSVQYFFNLFHQRDDVIRVGGIEPCCPTPENKQCNPLDPK